MAELSDQEAMRLGALRLLALREKVGERRANLMLHELRAVAERHGFEPSTETAMVIVGKVTDSEWQNACTRIPEDG